MRVFCTIYPLKTKTGEPKLSHSLSNHRFSIPIIYRNRAVRQVILS